MLEILVLRIRCFVGFGFGGKRGGGGFSEGVGGERSPLTFDPATMTRITTSFGLGVGMGTVWRVVWRVGVGWTIISFIVCI